MDSRQKGSENFQGTNKKWQDQQSKRVRLGNKMTNTSIMNDLVDNTIAYPSLFTDEENYVEKEKEIETP